MTEAIEGTMPRKLAISPDLKLPLDAVTRRIGILGMSGSGKTTTAAVLTEEILKQRLPTAIVDPKDDFWGLRSSRDGKSEGLSITVLGGEHGDAALEETGGKLVADMVVDEAPQLVLSMAHFSKSAMKRFATDFFERLYHRNREALNVIVDEADLFAPQHVPKGDGLRLFGALDDLVRRGRKRGIGVTMICQRSSIINKDILTQCELLIAHRASHPLDIDPVVTWMRAARMPEEKLVRVQDEIAKLANGEAWVMSPHWLEKFARVQMRDRETFDSSATPEPGQRRILPKVLAPVDLKLLQERMAETIERAKATDPRLLRQRIAELERQVIAKVPPPAPPPPAKQKRVEVPVLKEGHLKRLEAVIERAAAATAAADNAAKEVRAAMATVVAPHPPGPGWSLVGTLPKTPLANRPPPAPRPHRDPPPPPTGEPVKLRRGERHILEVAARSHPAKRSWAQLATLAGFTASGGTFGTYMGVLKRCGFLEEEVPDLYGVTPAGFEEIGEIPPNPLSREEVLDTWRKALRAGERRILDYLVEKFPAWTTKIELAEGTGFTADGGTFGTYVGVLVRNGLAEKQGRGEDEKIRAGQALFLDA